MCFTSEIQTPITPLFMNECWLVFIFLVRTNLVPKLFMFSKKKLFSHFHNLRTRENSDGSTHSMKYIWYSPQKSKYPLFTTCVQPKCNQNLSVFCMLIYLLRATSWTRLSFDVSGVKIELNMMVFDGTG